VGSERSVSESLGNKVHAARVGVAGGPPRTTTGPPHGGLHPGGRLQPELAIKCISTQLRCDLLQLNRRD